MINDFSAANDTRSTVQVPLFDREITTDVSGDYSLPDYQPEIKRLLRIRTSVLPPVSPAGVGSVADGGELTGALCYYVLYMGHDNALYCAPLPTEYRIALPEDAVRAAADVGEPILCLCDAAAEPAAGRVTAPRRLNIRSKVNTRVMIRGECPAGPEPLSELSADTPSEYETLSSSCEVGRLLAGAGDVLRLQDDLIPTSSDKEWRVVCAEGAVMVTEAAPAEGLVNCRGEVTVKLTLCPAEPLSDGLETPMDAYEPAAVTVMQRKLPFAVAIPLTGVTPACMATARGFCSDLSVEVEEGHIHVDLGILCEVRAQKNEIVTYRKDMYSTRRGGTSRTVTCPAERAVRALNGNFTLSDSLSLTDAGIDPAARVLDVTATATPEGLICDPAKGRCVLTGICRAHLLLARDGELSGADMTLPFRYEFDDTSLYRAGEGDAEAADTLHYDGGAEVITCRARMDGERVALDAELAVSLRTSRPAPMTVLSEVTFTDSDGSEHTRRRGEYVICFPAPTDTLWSVAKRYRAPVAALAAANNLPAGPAPDSPESLDGVGYLIV